jgi:ABC-type spermidine/putrescine transport system permease subunit II
MTMENTSQARFRLPFWRRLMDWAPTGTGIIFGYSVLFILYFPIVMLMLLSFSGDPLTGIPGDWTITWYEDVIFADIAQRDGEAYGSNFRVGDPLLLSIMLACITAVACVIAVLIVGPILPRIKWRGPFLVGFLMPLMIPGIIGGVGLFMWYRLVIDVKMGIWSLVLAHFVWAFPFALLAMLVVASRFDIRLMEAAKDLGAKPWQRFWQIEMPLLKPGIYAAGFFGFLLSFNELPFSIFMRAGQDTLPLYLWIQSGAHNTTVPLIYAMSTIITVGSIGLTFLAIKLAFGGGQKNDVRQ